VSVKSSKSKKSNLTPDEEASFYRLEKDHTYKQDITHGVLFQLAG
jgi:hypothetical protein